MKEEKVLRGERERGESFCITSQEIVIPIRRGETNRKSFSSSVLVSHVLKYFSSLSQEIKILNKLDFLF